MFIFLAKAEIESDPSQQTWMSFYGYTDKAASSQYLLSFYWIVVTFATLGYVTMFAA
jgi:hypothetical protein